MSGKKGMGDRIWSKEEKLKYVRKHLDEHVSIEEIGKESGIHSSTISAWVKKYLEKEEEELARKSGNIFAALKTSKNLSEIDRLRLLVAK